MRYLSEGRSLAKVIAGTPLDNRSAAQSLFEQVARAVDHAHTRNVLHRDIKPSNILISEGGRAYVADFGLGQLLGAPGRRCDGGRRPGLAPVHVARAVARPRAGHGSDIYSLGATLQG